MGCIRYDLSAALMLADSSVSKTQNERQAAEYAAGKTSTETQRLLVTSKTSRRCVYSDAGRQQMQVNTMGTQETREPNRQHN